MDGDWSAHFVRITKPIMYAFRDDSREYIAATCSSLEPLELDGRAQSQGAGHTEVARTGRQVARIQPRTCRRYGRIADHRETPILAHAAGYDRPYRGPPTYPLKVSGVADVQMWPATRCSPPDVVATAGSNAAGQCVRFRQVVASVRPPGPPMLASRPVAGDSESTTSARCCW
jgi:hypothetical protein